MKIQKNITQIAIITGFLMLIPLMLQLTIGTGKDGQGFNWKIGDFIVFSILIFCAGLSIDFVMKKQINNIHRLIGVTIIVILFLLIYINLAVGIINNWPFAGS